MEFYDLYCERTEWGMLNEPFNVLSNLPFFICFLICLLKYKDKHTGKLIWMYLPIFLGSVLWHTWPIKPFLLLDVLPIAVWMLMCTFIALTRIPKWGVRETIFFQAVSIGGIYGLAQLASFGFLKASGANYYLGTSLAFAFVACVCNSKYLWAATSIYSVSLLFRVFDIPACDYFSVGSHFVWHLFNSVAMFVSIIGVYKHK